MIIREQTIFAENPSVYYEPFVKDGRVGYRVQTNNAGDTRETFIYFNPSTDTDDGTPNVFIYVGEEGDPESDEPVCHIDLDALEDGPLAACGHNLHQRDVDTGECHGCSAGEEPHTDWTEADQ